MSINTDTIPFKTFCTLIDDSSRCGEFNIDPDEWAEFKQKYQEENLSPKSKELLRAYKKVVRQSIELSRAAMLYSAVLGINGSWEEYFKAAKIKYTGDKEKDLQYLEMLNEKHKQYEQRYVDELLMLEKEMEELAEEELKEEFNIKRVNEAIASLELHGFSIPNYEEFTLGRYEAMTEVIKKKNASNGK